MTVKDLQETAALAHLNLKDEELASAYPAFEQMLGFFAAMQAADNDTEAFTVPITSLSRDVRVVDSAFFRADTLTDTVESKLTDVENEILLNNAGERDARFILIPNVL
ncbi:MAG: aspartyl/glutamyl-tRNA amidotransferase subunit C [Treponema sp.]|jgi:aspartyl-tRNA(Asn)/glutamyl-tRNA(Gln) amidotransferase subunit C|nr:aspartyl/glutamyl-tRNA amidotransferase subunit C [Treponema sp.]